MVDPVPAGRLAALRRRRRGGAPGLADQPAADGRPADRRGDPRRRGQLRDRLPRSGPKVFSREDSWLLNKKHLHEAHEFYEQYGGKTIILARFMPIVRTFAPFVAGIGKMNYARFAALQRHRRRRLGPLFLLGRLVVRRPRGRPEELRAGDPRHHRRSRSCPRSSSCAESWLTQPPAAQGDTRVPTTPRMPTWRSRASIDSRIRCADVVPVSETMETCARRT